jgi:hypothetical protein
MPRTRNIKPGFFQNDNLGALPPLVRLFFAGLWCWADRSGRLEDRPSRLKAQILPYDNIDPEAMLEALANSPERFIIRYNVNGDKYIQIRTFNEHQNPHCAEQASTIPAPDLHVASTVQVTSVLVPPTTPSKNLPLTTNHSPRISGASTVHAPCMSGAPSKNQRRQYEYSVEFLEFWKVYPRQRKKPEAKAAYDRAVARLNGVHPDVHAYLLARCRVFADSDSGARAGSFCPHPATWLNAEQYAEEDSAWVRAEPSNSKVKKPHDEQVRWLIDPKTGERAPL